jgi:hypothetical protein
MCKEMLVIPVNKAVDPKRIIGKKWRAKEEETHKGSLTPQKILKMDPRAKLGPLGVGVKISPRSDCPFVLLKH